LPSEPEWEKAARGGLDIPAQPLIHPAARLGPGNGWQVDGKSLKMAQNPEPQRAYPWGEAFERNFANVGETGVGSTNAPGCFPQNVSPYGVAEMSGNIWEWLRGLSGKYPYPASPKERAERENLVANSNTARVVRGGSFGNEARYARCAYRNWYDPDGRLRYYGFRVVVHSPGFLSRP
ncbi:MAG: formylglycine-generating enzyme family protein, partial [Chloroflexi bacterium]